jgi:predicted house-cleaning noncanonical NTP pyrophosphatase (MazG superfamily)
MNRKIYHKLVRDRIPEIIQQEDKIPEYRVLDDNSFNVALRQKLLEESQELINAKTTDELLNELADVMECLENIAAQYDISMDLVKDRQTEKRTSRGGFSKKLFLEHVDEV